MLRREQGDNHPTQNGLNIGLEESQHQSLVKSTIAGQQLHQIALSEICFSTEQGQPEKVDPENNTRLLVTLATKTKNFCLELTDSGLRLKKKHPYYSQVQGGMAIRRMQWCDFVVYTYTSVVEDIHVERIYFDPTFWVALKGKLVDFYLFAMIPELLTTRLKRGIPLYPNIFSYK